MKSLPSTVWDPLIENCLQLRDTKPRSSGLTCVLDKHLGINALQDLIDIAAPYIDVLKMTSLTTAFQTENLLRQKIAMLRQADIEICPGGTCSEVMIWQGVFPAFLRRTKELGFTGIEISDGTIDMSDEVRKRSIGSAIDMGFKVFSEIGNKEWSPRTGLQDLIEGLQRDLSYGAKYVIVEAMEIGKNVGIMDEKGLPDEKGLAALINAAKGINQIIFEAPLRHQQEIFIDKLGANVNLGNIPPSEVLVVEATRHGTTGIPLMSAYERNKTRKQKY